MKPAPKKTYAKPKGRAADAQGSNQGHQEKKKSKDKSKGKGSQTKPTAKSGDVDFDDNAQAEHEDQDEEQEQDEHEDDPEAYVVEAQDELLRVRLKSDRSSECKDYKDGVATVACASPDSFKTHKDTWEWRGPCCLVRVHRQLRRCLFTPTWKEDIWQGLTVQPQRITHVKPQDQSFLSPVIENVKSVDLLRPRKVSYPWTGETQFRVTPAACGSSVCRTSARILVPVNDMNPMAIADSGASHVILPQSALFDSKSAKPVNLRDLQQEKSRQSKHIGRSLLNMSQFLYAH